MPIVVWIYLVVKVKSDAVKNTIAYAPRMLGPWIKVFGSGQTEVARVMARVNIDILGISELKWTGMGEFNSDDHYIYCGQEILEEME